MLLTIRVLPRSTRNTVEWENEILKVRLTAPPVDNAANKALLTLLAEHLNLPKHAISIVRGTTARLKTVEIQGFTEEEIKLRLQSKVSIKDKKIT